MPGLHTANSSAETGIPAGTAAILPSDICGQKRLTAISCQFYLYFFEKCGYLPFQCRIAENRTGLFCKNNCVARRVNFSLIIPVDFTNPPFNAIALCRSARFCLDEHGKSRFFRRQAVQRNTVPPQTNSPLQNGGNVLPAPEDFPLSERMYFQSALNRLRLTGSFPAPGACRLFSCRFLTACARENRVCCSFFCCSVEMFSSLHILYHYSLFFKNVAVYSLKM